MTLEKPPKLPEVSIEFSPLPDVNSFDKIEENVTIAVARDKAFCFYYKDNLDILKKYGVKIVEFSPLTDTSLPENIHGIYFGGGYPEVYAKDLSNNISLLKEIKEKSDTKMPIYGECGGFMYLCSFMTDANREKKYPMAGCFPFSVEMSSRLRSLGYREVRLLKDTVIGKKGDVLRGHEFHYSSLLNDHSEQELASNIYDVYDVTQRSGKKIDMPGFLKINTLGSYFHVHFGSMESSGMSFVHVCLDYKNQNL